MRRAIVAAVIVLAAVIGGYRWEHARERDAYARGFVAAGSQIVRLPVMCVTPEGPESMQGAPH